MKRKVRPFFEMIKNHKGDFQTKVDFYCDRMGNLIGGQEDLKMR